SPGPWPRRSWTAATAPPASNSTNTGMFVKRYETSHDASPRARTDCAIDGTTGTSSVRSVTTGERERQASQRTGWAAASAMAEASIAESGRRVRTVPWKVPLPLELEQRRQRQAQARQHVLAVE